MAEPGRRCVTFGLHDTNRQDSRFAPPKAARQGAAQGGAAMNPPPDFHLLQNEDGEWLARKGEPLLYSGELRLQGRHNIANALAALALGDAANLPFDAMLFALRTFRGLDHRMQWVANIGGISWINDSKATNIGACQAALDGLGGNIVLIAGGDGKGADFSQLAPSVARRVRAAVLMGQDAPLLELALGSVTQTVRVTNMHEAVRTASNLAQPGDTVLLSPACASWDQYEDYRQRGRMFAEEVGRLKG
jgi:UDP-N-acetylmuramoylalanine--D-glutamate ligase